MKSPALQFIAAFLLAMGAIAGYSAGYVALSQKSIDVADLQSKITAVSNTINRTTSAHTTIAKVSADEADIKGYFVSEAQIASLVSDFEARGLAQKASVTVTSVSADTQSSRPAYLIGLTVQGTFDAVARTIGAIEYAPYDLSLKSLVFEHDLKGAWHASLSLLVGSISSEIPAHTP